MWASNLDWMASGSVICSSVRLGQITFAILHPSIHGERIRRIKAPVSKLGAQQTSGGRSVVVALSVSPSCSGGSVEICQRLRQARYLNGKPNMQTALRLVMCSGALSV